MNNALCQAKFGWHGGWKLDVGSLKFIKDWYPNTKLKYPPNVYMAIMVATRSRSQNLM